MKRVCFNPCFNESMYKLYRHIQIKFPCRFNPCFNGSMYKQLETDFMVGTTNGFNPCFNGSMYKNKEKD